MNSEGLERIRSLGQTIQRRRVELHLSRARLAAKASITASKLHRIEHDETSHPAPNDLARIAEALRLSAADLFILAGYTTPHDLPSFPLYLHLRYANLSAGALKHLEAVFRDVVHERAA